MVINKAKFSKIGPKFNKMKNALTKERHLTLYRAANALANSEGNEIKMRGWILKKVPNVRGSGIRIVAEKPGMTRDIFVWYDVVEKDGGKCSVMKTVTNIHR